MMKCKIISCFLAAVCLTATLTACGNNNSETASTSQEPKVTIQNTLPSAPKVSFNTPSNIKPRQSIKVTPNKHSNKCFMLEGSAISITMENGWEIEKGGNKTDNQTDCINSFPAVIKYLDTKNTIIIDVSEQCEDKDTFLANTKESYIEAYQVEFDTLNISDFEQLEIDKADSFKIVADVVINGEKYKMTHIISNNVDNKDLSWMLLDSDGSFNDFDFVEALNYPIKFDRSKVKRFGDEDFTDYYRWDNDKKEAVKVE